MVNPEVKQFPEEIIFGPTPPEIGMKKEVFAWRPRDLDSSEKDKLVGAINSTTDFRGLISHLKQAREAGFIDEVKPNDPRFSDLKFFEQRIAIAIAKLRQPDLAQEDRKKFQRELVNISRSVFIDRNPKTREVKYYTYSAYLPYSKNREMRSQMLSGDLAKLELERRLGLEVVKALNDKRTELSRAKREKKARQEATRLGGAQGAEKVVPQITVKPAPELRSDQELATLERLHAGFLELKKLMDEEDVAKDSIHTAKLRDRQAQIERQVLRTLWKAGVLNKLALESPEFSDVFIEESRDDAGKIIRTEGVVRAVKFNEDGEPIFDKDNNMIMEEVKRIEIMG